MPCRVAAATGLAVAPTTHESVHAAQEHPMAGSRVNVNHGCAGLAPAAAAAPAPVPAAAAAAAAVAYLAMCASVSFAHGHSDPGGT